MWPMPYWPILQFPLQNNRRLRCRLVERVLFDPPTLVRARIRFAMSVTRHKTFGIARIDVERRRDAANA